MSSSNLRNMFMVSPKDMIGSLALLFEAGLVPFVRSSPGRGKSAIYRQLAEDFNLELLDIRLSMYEPTDFSGLPFREKGRTEYMPTALFPLEDDPLPEGKDGWLVLLDEFNHAEPEMIRASYKIILDRKVGHKGLHPNAFVALAGNSIDDNALANNTGTALNSRVTHLTLGSDADYWINEVAAKFGYDHRILGFISANKDKLNDFDPDQDEHSFCCERTWEFVSKLISDVKNVSSLSPLIAGTITPGVAAEFIQFCEIYKDLVSVKEVLADPEGCRLPDDSPTRWALTTHLAKEVNVDNAAEILTYINRLPLQYVVIFMSMVRSQVELLRIPEVIKTAGRIGRAAH